MTTTAQLWKRFRERVSAPDPRVRLIANWRAIRSFADEPDLDKARADFRAHLASLDGATSAAFREAFILSFGRRLDLSGLSGITDQPTWERTFESYVAGSDPEAKRLRNLLFLRADLDVAHSAPALGALAAEAEVELGAAVTKLFDRATPSIEATVRGAPSIENAQALSRIADDYRTLIAAASPENKMRSHAQEMLANTIEFVARTYEALGRYSEAQGWYLEAARAYVDYGGDDHAKAIAGRIRAMTIAATGNVDAAVSAALGTILERPAAGAATGVALEDAAPLVALLQQTLAAADVFAARTQVLETVEALTAAGFVDPWESDVETAFAQWLDKRPEAIAGNALLAILARVAQYYATVTQARSDIALHEMPTAEHPAQMIAAEGDRAFAQLHRISQLISRMSFEADAAAERIARTWAEMAAETVVEDEAAFEVRLTAKFEASLAPDVTSELSNALARISTQKNEWMAQGKSLDGLLEEASLCQRRAAQAGIRRFVASFAILRADMLLMLQRPAGVIPLITSVRNELFAPDPEPASIPQSAPERAILVDLLAPLAIAHSTLGDDPAASAVAGVAIDAIERDRYNITSPYLQSSFFGTRSKLYAVGVWSAYKTQDHATMFERMELSKARSLAKMRGAPPIPALDRSELETAFRAVSLELDGAPKDPELLERRRRLWDLLAIERLAARNAPAVAFSLDAAREALDPDEAIVYYYWLSHNTFLVAAIDAREVVVERVVVKEPERAKLAALVRALSTLSGFNGNLDAGFARFSNSLLPEPIRAFVAGKGRLIFSPHRSLHQLPFHALTWTDGPLIERFAVSYAPNLSALLATADAAPPAPVLVISTDRYENGGQELDALAGTPLETTEIEAIYRAAAVPVTALKDETATRARLQTLDDSGLLAGFGTIHVATHGVSGANDEPMESKVYLRDGALDGLAISQLRLRADLVVLAACYAGQRAFEGRLMPELGGDDLFGLQAAFAMAGARAILGSLWVANDTAARSIMSGFHGNLTHGAQPEVALRSAILDYRRANAQRSQSYYWAQFFISVMGRRTRPKEAAHA
jgi:CHAT domain-containing protein